MKKQAEESEQERQADLMCSSVPMSPTELKEQAQVEMLVSKNKEFEDLPYFAFTRLIKNPSVRKEVIT